MHNIKEATEKNKHNKENNSHTTGRKILTKREGCYLSCSTNRALADAGQWQKEMPPPSPSGTVD